MTQHICPHCGKPGISGFRRVCLGPALPATCSQCGEKIGVSYWSMLTVLPLLAGIITPPLVTNSVSAGAIIGSLGTTVTFTLWAGLVPLVKR